jgi:hypothetical protein
MGKSLSASDGTDGLRQGRFMRNRGRPDERLRFRCEEVDRVAEGRANCATSSEVISAAGYRREGHPQDGRSQRRDWTLRREIKWNRAERKDG